MQPKDTTKNRLKKCSACLQLKPITDFWREKLSADGLRSKCKHCFKAQCLQRHLEIKDTPEFQQKQRDRRRRYEAENKEKVAAAKKRWATNNKEKLYAKRNERRRTDPKYRRMLLDSTARTLERYRDRYREKSRIKSAEYRPVMY